MLIGPAWPSVPVAALTNGMNLAAFVVLSAVIVDVVDILAVPVMFPVTFPVTAPWNAVALTVPTTSNSVDGTVFLIPILPVDPSILIISVDVPDTFALTIISLSCAD